MTHAPTRAALADIAARLEARRGDILAAWREAVTADPLLDAASDWTLKQFNDHFPDVLEMLVQGLRAWPAQRAPLACDERDFALAHARTRWAQGYTLGGVVREWGHFNTVTVDHLARCSLEATASEPAAHLAALGVWSRILNDQQAIGALEYAGFERAAAETRSAELQRLLDALRGETANRGRALETLASGMRNDLQLVMTSQALGRDGEGWHQAYELRKLSVEGFRGIERALTNMVTLANLEAALEQRTLARFDAGHGLVMLAEGLRHAAETGGLLLHADGPEAFEVEGDAERVRRLAGHLLACALAAPGARAVRMHWGMGTRGEARWQLVVEHTFEPAAGADAAGPLAHSLAVATDAAQQSAGIMPTGLEPALRRGEIPVACGDGVDLLIAKHLCELLAAGFEVEAEPGLVRYRASLPLAYSDAR